MPKASFAWASALLFEPSASTYRLPVLMVPLPVMLAVLVCAESALARLRLAPTSVTSTPPADAPAMAWARDLLTVLLTLNMSETVMVPLFSTVAD